MPSRRKLPDHQHRFGAHMSIAGGLHLAFERGRETGCDCMQVFVKNQRQWNAPPLTDGEVTAWMQARATAGIEPIVAHDSYLINLAAPDDALWKKSLDAFHDEIERCERLAIGHLVTHPGSHVGSGLDAGIRRIARAINEVHRETRGYAVRIALEVTAGQGTGIGHQFEHLRRIVDRVREPERMAVCIDTCHLFAAGYDLTTDEGYERTIAGLDEQIGIARVACFHLNDSKKPLGSRVDRHEHIGKGMLGRSAFRRLVNDARFASIPMIMETPKGTDDRGRDFDRLNLTRLRRMIQRV
jgi:deoxyribonuclease-4